VDLLFLLQVPQWLHCPGPGVLASANRHGSVSTVDDDEGLGDRADVFASGICVVPGVVFLRW